MYPLHFVMSPSKGTKSELATSTLPSRGPTIGLNCYITPSFLGVLRTGDKNRIEYLSPDL